MTHISWGFTISREMQAHFDELFPNVPDCKPFRYNGAGVMLETVIKDDGQYATVKYANSVMDFPLEMVHRALENPHEEQF